MDLKRFLFRGLSLLVFLCCSCRYRAVSVVPEEIIKIPVGTMRDEINLYTAHYFPYHQTDLFAIDPMGTYYIADKESNKILSLNNFGQLNYLIYNPDYRFDSNLEAYLETDQRWRFEGIGAMVSSEKDIYVSTQIAILESNGEKEEQLGEEILLFNREGNYRFAVGFDGRDGRPFTDRILRLYLDQNRDLFVLMKTPENDYQINRYNKQGKALGSYLISKRKLQSDPEFQIFYRKLKEQFSSSEDEIFFQIGLPYLSYDGNYFIYEGQWYVPPEREDQWTPANRYFLYSQNTNGAEHYHQLFGFPRGDALSLIGLTRHNLLVFLQTNPKQNDTLLFYTPQGKLLKEVDLGIGMETVIDFDLARNGLFSTLQWEEDFVSVSWWRTDVLFGKFYSFDFPHGR